MPTENVAGVMQIGAWLVDASLDSISRGAETQKLEPRTMRLLLCLAHSAPEVVSVDKLLTEVWSGVVVGSASVYQAVSQLRKLLGDTDPAPTYIVTVPRKGYRMIAAVRRVETSDEVSPSTPASMADNIQRGAREPVMARLSAVLYRIGKSVHRNTSAVGLAAASAIVILLALGVGLMLLRRDNVASPPAFAAPSRSVAVLPFVNVSSDKEQDYFSDGLTDELIDLLSQVQDLRVPARTSSFFFKGKNERVAVIARDLGVANILEGSVRKAGDALRVTVQLIRADNGYLLWSKTYDGDTKDIFKVQDAVSAAVVDVLKAKLAPAQPIASSRTANPEAYNQFLLGRQLFNRSDLDDFRRAVVAYQKAVALDPNYAAAFAGLAFAEAYVADYTGDAEGLKRAETAAEKAIPLAPEEADGYAARGYLRLIYRWDWSGAQTDLARALAINPSDSTVQRRHGDLLESLGRLPEAIAAVRKAIELDPLSSLAWHTNGLYLIFNQDYPAAHEALRRALEIQPDSVVALNAFGMLQLLEGNAAEALLTFRKNSFDGFRLAGVAMAEHTLGHVEESQQALGELIGKHAQSGAYQIAEVFGWRGEKDKAFEWLERAYRQRDGGLSNVKVDLLFASMRSDPRFNVLLRKMNLPVQELGGGTHK
jgi:TolB-like protein/DNA-binding winged helix-turn-helix (wHTH) protein/Flp pilus assembly protein TadD